MIHLRLKPTQRIKTEFNIVEESKTLEIPDQSKDLAQEYLKSEKLSDEYEMDLTLFMEDEIIYGFDYLYNGNKIIIPEINPALIFYSNAIMSFIKLNQFKKTLLENSPLVRASEINIDPKFFGNYFQLATNTIINLQATIENFLNNSIPDNFIILSNNNKEIKRPNIHDKIDYGIVKLKGKNFEENSEDDYLLVKELIDLRNDIIHLKPIQEDTNTKYKKLFRRVIDFDFENGILAIKKFINFYEPNLIEECPCGKEYYYDIIYE
jgi:hypothetical protein